MKRKHFLWVYSIYNKNFEFEINRCQWSARPISITTTSLEAFKITFKELFSRGDGMFYADEFRLIQFMFEVESGTASINAELEMIRLRGCSESTIPTLFKTCEQILKKHGVKVYRTWKFYEKR